MQKKVPDDVYVVMPNQQGIDDFDFVDALGKEGAYVLRRYEGIY